MLKTPDFWTKKNLFSYLLLPFSLIYLGGFLIIKFFSKTTKISKPVICIGNLIAGGSGKTPTAIAIGKILQEMLGDFAYLSRGYKGEGSKFLSLKKGDGNKAEQVGDEPILLMETAPTFVANNRLFGAQEIDKMDKFKMIIIDDGMQNASLYQDFTILVVDGNIGFGNDFLIPAGPMREPLFSGLKKSDMIVVIGDAKAGLLEKFVGKTIVKAKINVTNLEEFKDKKLIAFCGLAYPQKFFSLLKREVMEVIETLNFPDHHNYSKSELEKICKIAQKKGAYPVTTKKDWVKFPADFKDKIPYLDIDLEFEDKELVKSKLKKFL